MDLTVPNIYGLLLRSKLAALDEAKAMFERWNKEAKENCNDVSQFTKWLVNQRYLTEYQASLLARGHADGFFVGQYKIMERIGRGRMAGVYKAIHPLGQIVAVKVLPPSKAKDPMMLARFQREAKLASLMKHPNIVRTFQVGRFERLHFIVMECLDGETLDEVIARRTRLPATEAVRIVHQALLGLQHIYEQKLVHRDLKPSNLMLAPAPTPGPQETTLNCSVKILDIGLARTLFDENDPDGDSEMQLTAEGLLLGTPDYMAPEQARDARSADIRADIYSLGCVLYNSLTGQRPFPDTNVISQMVRHATEQPTPLRQFTAQIPEGLQQIVDVMMAKDPNHRFATPERAAQALQAFLSAGMEKKVDFDAGPQMISYLSWLAEEEKKATANPPVVKPPSGATPLMAPEKSAKRDSKKKAFRTEKREPAPVSAPPAMAPTAPPISVFDVELVPINVVAPAKPTDQDPYQLSKRDFLIFTIGSVSAVLAGYVGYKLASRDQKETTSEK